MYQNEEYDFLFSRIFNIALTWELLIIPALTNHFSLPSSFYFLSPNFLLFVPVGTLLLSKELAIKDKRK